MYRMRISTELDRETGSKVDEACEKYGLSKSEFLRLAVNLLLANEDVLEEVAEMRGEED